MSFSLIPYNDNSPVITLQNNSIMCSEQSSCSNGVQVFPSLGITDADEECQENMLEFANITLYAVGGENETISVRYHH